MQQSPERQPEIKGTVLFRKKNEVLNYPASLPI
jgi:hypothetical protein